MKIYRFYSGKLKDVAEATLYLQQTIEHNWSRAILTLQIEQDLFKRQGKAITNFKNTFEHELNSDLN